MNPSGPLAGKTIVVSAGGTQEPLDPVRVLTNRSSGKQGYALVQAALDAGAQVTLITTPTALTPPIGARLVKVETARQNAILGKKAEAPPAPASDRIGIEDFAKVDMRVGVVCGPQPVARSPARQIPSTRNLRRAGVLTRRVP